MALVRSTSSLDEALAEFNGKLTPDEKVRFRALPSIVPDDYAPMTLTAQLDADAQKRSGRRIASRVFSLLQSVQQFSGVVGTFVSSNPAVAALVWGSVQFMLQLANNSFGYYDHLSLYLNEIGKLCPRFSDYQALYQHATKLQSALQDFYAALIRCCTHVCEVLRRPSWQSLVRNAWMPFETEFRPFRAKIQERASDVKHEIEIAAARAADEERKAQAAYRMAWKRGKDERDVQKRQRADHSRRERLLDQLSSYDQNIAYSQARRSSSKGTAEWLFENPDFKDWMSSTQPSILWMAGKLGAGKTVLMSNAIAHLFLNRKKATQIAYFFCRFNEETSLQSATILRSIVRQCLSASSLNDKMEAALTKVVENGSILAVDLVPLLKMVFRNQAISSSFILIDGIHECSEDERHDLLYTLHKAIQLAQIPVKLMVTSRDRFPNFFTSSTSYLYVIVMEDNIVQTDIATYVASELETRQRNGRLKLGDVSLGTQIEASLVAGAQGMFLWAALQMDEVCRQDCDYDIRKAIRHLPVSLEETYERILMRIAARARSKRAREIFEWVIVAKRPLSLDELQEALAVEKFADVLSTERFINDIGSVTSWCEGLIVLDEVSDEIYFSHPTIRSSVVLFYTAQETPLLELLDMDKSIGEVCVTYLNFNDFNTALIRRDAAVVFTADQILEASLATTALSRRLAKPLLKLSRYRSTPPDVRRLLQTHMKQHTGSEWLSRKQHPFLAYAAEYWLAHAFSFRPSDRIWALWCRLLEDGHDMARKPWAAETRSKRNEAMKSYIIDHDHVALFQFLTFGAAWTHEQQFELVLEEGAKRGQFGLFQQHYVRKAFRGEEALHFAARHGYRRIFQTLIFEEAADDDWESRSGDSRGMPDSVLQYCKALKFALEEKYDDIVDLLFAAGTDIDDGKTLCVALKAGYLNVVRKIIDAGWDVKAGHEAYSKALFLACKSFHDDIVRLLIHAGMVLDEDHVLFNFETYAAKSEAYREAAKTLDFLKSGKEDI